MRIHSLPAPTAAGGPEQALRALSERFQDIYGSPPDVLARAPGRVNLIGEHVDYSGGSVMPMAVQQVGQRMM